MAAANTKLGGLTTNIPAFKVLEKWTNNVAKQINTISPITGGFGISSTMVPGVGTTIAQSLPGKVFTQWYPAIIQSTGPGGAADYTDARYWFKFATLMQSSTNPNDVAKFVVDTQDSNNSSAQTVTNIVEIAGSTHNLTAGAVIYVTPLVGNNTSNSTTPIYQWLMSQAGLSPPTTITNSSLSFSSTVSLSPLIITPISTLTLPSVGLWEIATNAYFHSQVFAVTNTYSYMSLGIALQTTSFDYPSTLITSGQALGLTVPVGSPSFEGCRGDFTVPKRVYDNRTSGSSTLYLIFQGITDCSNYSATAGTLVLDGVVNLTKLA